MLLDGRHQLLRPRADGQLGRKLEAETKGLSRSGAHGKRLEIPGPSRNDNPAMQPPVLPAATLARLLRLARLDGTGVLAIAGAFAIGHAAMGERGGALIGLLVAGAGAVELHGASLLGRGNPRGLRWLVGSQLYLLAAILGYVALRLVSYDPALINLVLTDGMRQHYLDAGLHPEEMDLIVKWSYYLTYVIVGMLTVVYQGLMLRFYLRHWADVQEALDGN